jgi:hypothetical protein
VVAQYWSATGRPAPEVPAPDAPAPEAPVPEAHPNGGRHARRVVPGRAGRHERRR